MPSENSNGKKHSCQFDRGENKKLRDLLTAFAARHPEKVKRPFPKTGFTLELDHDDTWVHIPRGVTSVSEFYSFHLVHRFVGIKEAEPAVR